MKRFGFTNPILVSDDYEIIAGHGRFEAAKLLGKRLGKLLDKLLGLAGVPVVRCPYSALVVTPKHAHSHRASI